MTYNFGPALLRPPLCSTQHSRQAPRLGSAARRGAQTGGLSAMCCSSVYIYAYTYTSIYIYIYIYIYTVGLSAVRRSSSSLAHTSRGIHPVSITRFPLTIFSPGSGLLGNLCFTISTLIFSRVWVRKDGNLVMETGCICCSNVSRINSLVC